MNELKQEFSLPECSLSKGLQSYRKSGKYCNVTLIVKEQCIEHQYKAHKLVLSIASSVLEKQLSQTSSMNITLDAKNVKPVIMEDLLDFFYISKITLTFENVYDIFRAAQYLEIPFLLQSCEQFVIEKLRPNNAFRCYFTLERRKIEKFRVHPWEYMLNYIRNVVEEYKRDNLTSRQLRTSIQLMFENFDQPPKSVSVVQWSEHVFELCIHLAKHSPSQDLVLSLLLRNLQIDKLSSRFLKKILSEEIIPESHPLTAFLANFLLQIVDYNGLYCFSEYVDYIDEDKRPFSYLSSIKNPRWRPINQKICWRMLFGSAVVKNQIFIAGGLKNAGATDSFEMFNCFTKNCTELAVMPHTRSSCAAAACNDFVYVSGGVDHACVDKAAAPLSSMIRYSIPANKWESCAQMATPRICHQLIELKGRLYAIGGFINLPEKKQSSSKNFNYHKFSLKNAKKQLSSWKPSLEKKITTSKNSVFQIALTVEVYDPEIDQWKLAGDTNFGHYMFGAVVHNGKIYVCGYDGFEVYSPESDTWKVLPSPPNEYHGRCLVSFGGKLLALGGVTKMNGSSKIVIEYNSKLRQWSEVVGMNIVAEGFGHSSFVVDF